jgi:BolA family transcriptional regulator, general stress-responsive regulator
MRVDEAITDKLVAALGPVALEVIDESHMHRVRKGAQTHFKVVVVAPAFEGKTLVQRHRLVHELLAEELRAGVHALSIHAYTPAQWTERGGAIPASPPCRGAGKAPRP